MVYLIPLLVLLLVMTKTRSAWLGCLILFLAFGLVQDKRVLGDDAGAAGSSRWPFPRCATA